MKNNSPEVIFSMKDRIIERLLLFEKRLNSLEFSNALNEFSSELNSESIFYLVVEKLKNSARIEIQLKIDSNKLDGHLFIDNRIRKRVESNSVVEFFDIMLLELLEYLISVNFMVDNVDSSLKNFHSSLDS